MAPTPRRGDVHVYAVDVPDPEAICSPLLRWDNPAAGATVAYDEPSRPAGQEWVSEPVESFGVSATSYLDASLVRSFPRFEDQDAGRIDFAVAAAGDADIDGWIDSGEGSVGWYVAAIYAGASCGADVNGDSAVDVFDLIDFLVAFADGCASGPRGSHDSDGDGRRDHCEFAFGSDPTDAPSTPLTSDPEAELR